ncbi:MAG: hypothetical protein KatS3mg027_1570 [Bacteroidia bacterium]|nr:MAG: hypothetical protein KatS3mg027_1570 [Bacteroidia bacterium]
MKELFILLKKEFLLDFRESSGLTSVIVYLISILYSTSLLFKNNYTPVSYSSVYLIIFLFTSIIISYRNFAKEDKNSTIFNYLFYSPIQYILGKIIYSSIMNLVVAFLLFVLFVLFNGLKIENLTLFIINTIGLSIGMGIILTLMGSISNKVQSNFALMSIMSFPLLLPIMILSAKMCIASIQNIPTSMNVKYIFSLYSMDIICLMLASVLFPQVWEE